MYGYGTYGSYYNNYESYYDPDKYIQMLGASVSFGKRLRWPDDYFVLSMSLAYTRYMLKNWSYFLVSTGNCNNINFSLALQRNSTDNQLFPRRGSEFEASVTLTHHGHFGTASTTRTSPPTHSHRTSATNSKRNTVG